MINIKQPKFKTGDWCYCEFELQQVKETREDCVTEVSNGYVSHSSSDLSDRCYPMELNVKLISEEVRHWSRKIHDLNCTSLNHPDINRVLIDKWVEMCECREDHDKLQKKYTALANFSKAIIDEVENLRSNHSVEGINLFRR